MGKRRVPIHAKAAAGKAAVNRSGEMLRSAKEEASSRIEQADEIAREKVKDVKKSARTEA